MVSVNTCYSWPMVIPESEGICRDLAIPMQPLVFPKRLLRQITFLGNSLPCEFQDPKLELPTIYKA